MCVYPCQEEVCSCILIRVTATVSVTFIFPTAAFKAAVSEKIENSQTLYVRSESEKNTAV